MASYSQKRIGVILSGCGVYDGSEIHEAVITLLALDEAGAQFICLAPSANQMHVINHISAQVALSESRNVLEEAARIARGTIQDISHITANSVDALIFPGGFGAAKNLCTFATQGVNCSVNQHVNRLVKEMHQVKKPMGFICIAPVIAAKILGEFKPKLTIGNDASTAEAIEKMGGKHIKCRVDEIAIDEANRLVSTPAYMLGPSIRNIAVGIRKCVNQVLAMTK